jgi:pyruvate ferredoxin oxidoreductase delta subunit
MEIPTGAVAHPGTSEENETGTWRAQAPVYLHEKCTGCRLCQWYCPDDCVHGDGKLFEPDLRYCKGCGICAEVCPVKDIIMQTEAR